MKFCNNLLSFCITNLFIINIIFKKINSHYNYKSLNLRKSNEDQNIIEIEMVNNLTGNIKIINLENSNIDLYINEEKQSNFNNFIQFENNKTYKIKLIFPNDFDGSCQYMFKNISLIRKITFQNFNVCKNMNSMFAGCFSLLSIDFSSLIQVKSLIWVICLMVVKD